MLVSDILYSYLMELCLLFKLFKHIVSYSLVPVHEKSLMNRKYINESPRGKRYISSHIDPKNIRAGLYVYRTHGTAFYLKIVFAVEHKLLRF